MSKPIPLDEVIKAPQSLSDQVIKSPYPYSFTLPELPEVELVRRDLVAKCLHRTIISVNVLDGGVLDKISIPQLRTALMWRSITKVERHGKQLFLKIERSKWLTVHLGMTGDLVCLGRLDELPRFTRMLIEFEDGGHLVFQDMRKFGAIGLASSKDRFLAVKHLGPDALVISGDDFVERTSMTSRHIKTVIMDQSVIAGVGNLYSDEALFQCKVHPLTRSNTLSRVRLLCLHEHIQEILRASIELETDFDRLPKKFLLRDRSPSSKCPRGHGLLQTMKVNGRTAYLCPECQRPR